MAVTVVPRPSANPTTQSSSDNGTTLRYLLILDFEASCWESGSDVNQEIIEFPTLLYNIQERKVEATFHKYVKPIQDPKLSEFCTKLTGITQETVDAAETFPTVWRSFLAFLDEHGVLQDPASYAFLCCGDWDMKTMLPKQLDYEGSKNSNLQPLPPLLTERWINVKKVFQRKNHGRQAKGMVGMLHQLKLKLEGRHHSGIDDCRNIAKIVERLQSSRGWTPGADGGEFTRGIPPRRRNRT
ncbi:ribonuclease H-like domain-containing protein [Gymnopilus junonius]|uniref:Ribonuclease H-like domain-containing protein n=1 Tax=Gymnopilus junonius TaxID=109634 RepID=A0A9P5NM57_GYMJU|nr:ribonuclease H-like domain-containing protein [Gymnopilus junonius]